jgi:hypothetical protein
VSNPAEFTDLQHRNFLRERGLELAKLAELTLHHSREWMAAYLLDLAHRSFERSLEGLDQAHG